MKKMIYAVKSGRKTGIFNEWLKCSEQTDKYPNAKFRRFEYRSELEEEPEDVPGSLRHAIKEAEKYLGSLVYLGESADYLADVRWVEGGFLPFGDESEAENPEVYDEWPADNRNTLDVLLRYWKTAEGLSRYVRIIEDPRESAHTRISASKGLRRQLEKCLLDKNLNKLTAIYRGKEEENAIGYNPSAVSKFVQEMLRAYPKPELSEDPKSELSEDPGPELSEFEEVEEEVSRRQLLMQAGAIETELKDLIHGQDAAIERLSEAYFNTELKARSLSNRRGPRSVYLLAGPPGVGKAFMAEQFADRLGFHSISFDMSKHSDNKAIIESKPGEPGRLTGFVSKYPKCVLVFGEIEKADITVMRLLLQILDVGSCVDKNTKQVVSFKNTIIFLTTNAGKRLYSDPQNENFALLPDEVVMDALEKGWDSEPTLPSQILSRMSSHTVLMLNPLKADAIYKQVEKDIKKQLTEIKKEYGYEEEWGKEELAQTILYSMGGRADAGNASKIADKLMHKEMYELLKLVEEKQELDESGVVRRVEWKCDFEGATEKIRDFYFWERDCFIPVFGTVKYEPVGKIKNSNVRVENTVDIHKFMEMLHKENVLFAVIDYIYGLENMENGRNVVDAETIGRDVFLKIQEEDEEVPVYILDGSRGHEYTYKEKKALMKKGAAGFIERSQLEQTYKDICCQVVMEALAARRQILTYETKQEFDEKTKVGSIIFCGFKLETAVDPEDQSSILSDAERPNIKFDDVIGAEKAKEELRYFLQYLQKPRKFLMNGGQPPKGVLLYGDPGTGKTMLARAMAGESDAAFFQTSATEFMNKYLGESEANIRRIFAKAKEYAPSIIFIDEIDAIGKKRTGSDTTHHTESMLNALLTEMDGFRGADSNKPVFVLAATNFRGRGERERTDSLDDALLRRFDNKIYVDLPKESERERYILKMLADKNITTVSKEAAHSIAERTTGQSLAILQNVFKLAFRNAVRQSRTMTDDDLLTALEEYNHGEKKEYTPDYYKSVAVHETGHAYVSYISGDKPSYITIESRGNYGGYMRSANQEDVASYTREELLARIRISLAGRAAEEVFYGKAKSLNTGASSDLRKATDIAFHIVCTYGMEEDQLIVLKKDEVFQSALVGEYTAKVNEILKTEMKNTITMIEKAKDKIREIADVLARENRLTGKQFEELMEAEG